ncbi:MAG: phosphoribosylglycinamide formyltransferase [Halioglobus sp.]
MTSAGKARLAILISGRGSNMQAFIEACQCGQIDADITLVLSNKPDAAGLKTAADAGVATACVDHRNYSSREDFDAALVEALKPHKPDLVILAGFMRILTPVFITPFAGKLLNIHPSLLPKYPGLNTHRRALEAGDKEAGVTVHYVTPELDGGPPIIQARVPIQSGDTSEALAARVILREHIIYPIAARWQLEGRLQLDQQGATLDGKRIPVSGIDYVPGIE